MAEELNTGQDPGQEEDRLKAGVPGEGEQPPPEIDADDEHGGEDAKSQEDQALGADADDAARQEFRRNRAEEKRRRKEAQRRREEEDRRLISSLQRQNQEQAARLAALEQRSAGADIARIDEAWQQASHAAETAKARIKAAVEAQDGTAAAEANDVLLLARTRMQELARIREVAARPPQQPGGPQPLNPQVMAQAQSWMGRNRWYNPQSGDTDSQVMLALDNALSSEGWDPSSVGYWQELDERAKKYLPHRYPQANNGNGAAAGSRGSPKSVVGSSGRDAGGSSAAEAGGFRLSAERVAALKEAGSWDDEAKRAKAIQRYKDYDKEHGNVAR